MVRLVDVPEPERSIITGMNCPVFASTPFASAAPASERHVAIVSSAGFINRGERRLLPLDTSYRTIASTTADGDILCSHVSTNFDRTGFQQDLNVMLPRARLRELEGEGVIGKASDEHYSFMGATVPGKLESSARKLGRSLLERGVNTIVLAPV